MFVQYAYIDVTPHQTLYTAPKQIFRSSTFHIYLSGTDEATAKCQSVQGRG